MLFLQNLLDINICECMTCHVGNAVIFEVEGNVVFFEVDENK